MLDVLPCMNQQSCLYEVRQKGQPDACYVVVPNTNDLVKSHLMFAVREEVEVLKERIAELMERINQLEVENGILRAHATPEALSQLGGVPPASAPQGLANAPPATVKQPAAAAGNPANGSVS